VSLPCLANNNGLNRTFISVIRSGEHDTEREDTIVMQAVLKLSVVCQSGACHDDEHGNNGRISTRLHFSSLDLVL